MTAAARATLAACASSESQDVGGAVATSRCRQRRPARARARSVVRDRRRQTRGSREADSATVRQQVAGTFTLRRICCADDASTSWTMQGTCRRPTRTARRRDGDRRRSVEIVRRRGRHEQRLQDAGAADRVGQALERRHSDPSGVDVAIDLADGDLADRWRGAQVVHVVDSWRMRNPGGSPSRPRRGRGFDSAANSSIVYRLVANAVVVFFTKVVEGSDNRSCGFPADSVTRGLDDKKLLGKKDAPYRNAGELERGKYFSTIARGSKSRGYGKVWKLPAACRARARGAVFLWAASSIGRAADS